jgi:O-antigen chain-terminating methyltransferase
VIDAKKQFYRAFEERFRGSRENIKEKLKIYLPFIQPLHQRYPKGIVVDIGCGRGEFIELMQEVQISAKGIDLDEGMLEAGLSLGLDMQKGDGLSFLRTMEDESAIAVTAFHVVEHISFDELQDLINEVLRVLKPGGLIILETPNPENIRVSSETFYLDPTHLRPIPSGLLSFMTEYYGYSRTKIIRLQESEVLSSQIYANIAQVLEGVSPDYAVVAQKEAVQEVITLLDAPFSTEYGLPLSSLVEKFERRMLRFEELVDKIMKKAAMAEEFAWKAEIQASQAKEHAENAWRHYQALVNSRSWKLTKPFRYSTDTARRIKSKIKHTIRASIQFSKKYINRSPKLKMYLLKLLDHFPRLKQKIKHINEPGDILQEPGDTIKIDPAKTSFPDAETILNDLQKAIEKQMEKRNTKGGN